jgi:quercetin dioxygenase-like cupin family protein
MLQFLTFLVVMALAQPGAERSAVIDDERVRVLVVTDEPGHKSPLHQHDRNRVMIYLDPGTMRLAYEDGTVKNLRWKAGHVRWDPAGGKHTSENTAKAPFRIVEVEIKKPAGAAVRFPALDPPKIDPRHYKVEFENPQVRVVRARYGPRESAPMHEHALPRVVVNLTDQAVRITNPDGSTREMRNSAGAVAAAGIAKHSEVNLSDHPFEVLVVELKSR